MHYNQRLPKQYFMCETNLKFEQSIKINVNDDRLKWSLKNLNCIVQQRFLFLTVIIIIICAVCIILKNLGLLVSLMLR